MSGAPYGPTYFNGLIDEPTLYSRALSASEVAAIFNAGTAGKCGSAIAPFILTHPAGQTVIKGSSVTFNVLASGTSLN